MQPPRKRQSRIRVPAGAPAFAPCGRYGSASRRRREGCRVEARRAKTGEKASLPIIFLSSNLSDRSLSSVGRAPTWYVGGGWFETSRELQSSGQKRFDWQASIRSRRLPAVAWREAPRRRATRAGSPTAEAARSDRVQCEFKSRPAYHRLFKELRASRRERATTLPSPGGQGLFAERYLPNVLATMRSYRSQPAE